MPPPADVGNHQRAVAAHGRIERPTAKSKVYEINARLASLLHMLVLDDPQHGAFKVDDYRPALCGVRPEHDLSPAVEDLRCSLPVVPDSRIRRIAGLVEAEGQEPGLQRLWHEGCVLGDLGLLLHSLELEPSPEKLMEAHVLDRLTCLIIPSLYDAIR